jgi:hypothetical protein
MKRLFVSPIWTQSRPVLIPLPSWSCTGTRVSSVWTTREDSTRLSIALTMGSSRPAAAAIQPHIVERDSSTPKRLKIPSWR